MLKRCILNMISIVECTQDSDCAVHDYCKCPNDECSAGGACIFGCREVGVPCKNSDGVDGNCNGNHECVQSGEAWLTKLTIETRDCKECSTLKAGSGASIKMTVVPPGGEKSCTTQTLDDPATEDYDVGQAIFEDPTYLSTCFMVQENLKKSHNKNVLKFSVWFI